MRKLIRKLNRKTDFGEIMEDIKDFLWYDRISTFRTYKEMLQRMVYWAYHMRKSYDFDAHTIYDVIYRKLDRIHNVMKNHSHCMWNSSESTNRMRKLCEARHLAKKLSEFSYSVQGFIDTEKKYGHNSWLIATKGTSYHRYKSEWINDKENAKIYYKMRNKYYHEMENTERKRLFYLLDKYIEQWWD